MTFFISTIKSYYFAFKYHASARGELRFKGNQ